MKAIAPPTPLTCGDGLNLYAYVGNNPVNYYDPSGYGSCSKKTNPYGDRANEIPERMDTSYKPLTPKQKKALNQKLNDRTMSRDEYNQLQWDRSFNNRRKRRVDRFWGEEKKRLKAGKEGTGSWNEVQANDIMNGKTPTYNGDPIEGHHKYNALDYPQLADDPSNIYPATNSENFNRWHGGNWQNDTSGVPNNPLFEEEF